MRLRHSSELDAIEMPDMSVGRSKFAHPEWLRLQHDYFALWPVIGFRWGDVPKERFDCGILFVFKAEHKPEPRNYPHSEIKSYRESSAKEQLHVNRIEDLPDSLYLEWREEMHRLATRGIFLRFGQVKAIRTYSPRSYKPEDIPQAAD